MILTRNNDLPVPLVFLRQMRERTLINFAIDIRFLDNMALNYCLRLISPLQQARHGVDFIFPSSKRKDYENIEHIFNGT